VSPTPSKGVVKPRALSRYLSQRPSRGSDGRGRAGAAGTFGQPLDRICKEIEEDRATLEQVIDRLGFSQSRVKPAGAWVAEKLGRLKLNGRLRGYSPLSRVLELEGLLIGITGKMALWETLADLGDVERLEIDFAQMSARAAEQRSAVDDLHRLAAAALATDD